MSALRTCVFHATLAAPALQIGSFTFSALLPTGMGITLTVLAGFPASSSASNVGTFILPLTDRVDPRRVYICFVTLTCLSHLGMAFIKRILGRIALPDVAGTLGGTYRV